MLENILRSWHIAVKHLPSTVLHIYVFFSFQKSLVSTINYRLLAVCEQSKNSSTLHSIWQERENMLSNAWFRSIGCDFRSRIWAWNWKGLPLTKQCDSLPPLADYHIASQLFRTVWNWKLNKFKLIWRSYQQNISGETAALLQYQPYNYGSMT